MLVSVQDPDDRPAEDQIVLVQTKLSHQVQSLRCSLETLTMINQMVLQNLTRASPFLLSLC